MPQVEYRCRISGDRFSTEVEATRRERDLAPDGAALIDGELSTDETPRAIRMITLVVPGQESVTYTAGQLAASLGLIRRRSRPDSIGDDVERR